MKGLISRSWLLVFCLMLMTSLTQGQSYTVRSIKVSDGLSNGRIYHIASDSLGYLWFATANGLTRYSGSHLKKYQPGLNDTSFDPGVLKLLVHSGRLFALFQGGAIYEYSYLHDEWQFLAAAHGERFISIASYSDDELVVGTTSGILIFDIHQQTFSPKLLPELRYIRQIKKDFDKLYLSTSKGLHIFQAKSDGSLTFHQKILPERDILDFEIDKNKVIWIGTDFNGLFRYSNAKTEPVLFLHDKDKISIRDITIKNDGSVLLAVDREGFYMLDPFGQLLKKLSYDPEHETSLSQNSINTIYCDEDGVIWLGIGEIGLNLLYEPKAWFEILDHQKVGGKTIHNKIVRSIYQDSQGAIWIGTEGGLSKQNPDGGWVHFDESATGNLSAPVLALCGYRGDLLAGTYGEGMLRLDTETGAVSTFSKDLLIRRVYAMYWDELYLWVGGIDGPVSQILGDSVVNTYSCGQVKAFAEKGDRLLVGCVEGIYEIDPDGQKVEKYEQSAQPINNVYTMHYHKQTDYLWIGNDKGLVKLKYQTGEVINLDDFSKVSGAVYSIIPESPELYWIATEKGLFRYNVNNDDFRRFKDEDGQTIKEFGFGARSRLIDQRLAFGGPGGVVIVNPKAIKSDQRAPKIYFSSLLINGSVPEGGDHENINFTKDLDLVYDQNNIQLEIDYVKFHGSHDYQLEWQLKGWDDQVQRASNKTTIIYRNLPPGNYQLGAEVYNADGIRSANAVNLRIRIRNPFWLQWWALVIYALIAGMIIYIFITVNHALQERKISEEKMKFFIDVAHDIRTPVSLIRLASDQLLNGSNVEDSVQIINRYTRNLNEYVTELLDFQKSEKKMLKIMVSEFDLVTLVEQITEDFRPMADQTQIRITTELPPKLSVWGDRIQLGRVYTNLLSNAIKYNHDKGEVMISIEESGDHIFVNVKDNGLGIPKNQIDKIFTRFHRADNVQELSIRGTGIGLMLSKRIVELHRGSITVESEEHVGSLFVIRLLKGKNHFNPSDIIVSEPRKSIDQIKDVAIRGKRKVLVIEDNADIRDILQKTLSDDYTVLTAGDGKEGLFLVFESFPDLIITDVMLPKVNGKEICHIVKNDKKTHRIPVILLSALSGVSDKAAGLEVGADYYMEKPFDVEVLKLAIKNLLKRSQLDKEIRDRNEPQKQLNPEESFLSNVIAIIHANITNHQFSIDQLADEVGLSRSNLFRRMKTIASMSPSDVILEIKLNKAKELLKSEAHARIDDIAYQCGFNDPKYFSTIFKKHTNMTPSQYHASFHEAQ